MTAITRSLGRLFSILLLMLVCGVSSAATEMVFTTAPVVSGSGVNQTARWTNTGNINGIPVNVELKILALTAGSSVTFNTAGDDARVEVMAGFAVSPEVTVAYRFFNGTTGDGFTEPLTVIVDAGFKDIDDTNDETAIFSLADIASYVVETPTNLNLDDSGGELTVTSNNSGASTSDINIQVQFQPATELIVRYQIEAGVLTARWFDFDGNADLVFTTPAITLLDTTAPVVPTVVSQETNDATPVLTGTAEAYSTVSVSVGGAVFEVVATGAGSWTLDTSSTPVSGTFSPDVNGVNEIVLTSTDAAGNSAVDVSSDELTIDATAPTVEILGAPAVVTSLSPYIVTILFSEDVASTFTLADISVGNGTASNFVISDGDTYQVDITPDGNGDITLDVLAAAAQDAAGNDNQAATQVITSLVTDGDNNGIPDSVECPTGPPFNASCLDSDNDGTPDFQDQDSDNDGIPDIAEVGDTPLIPPDSDGDGIPDFQDQDSDADGIPDIIETGASGNDTDADGIDDDYDVDQTNGTDANNDGVDDDASALDTDADSIPDFLDLDSDNDGIPDVIEDSVSSGNDVDSDGIDDGYDVNQTGGTDADSDGIDDAAAATDTDRDGSPDYLDDDSDSDGISDQIEAGYDASGVDFSLDNDADGVPDAMDTNTVAAADINTNGIVDSLEPVNTDGDSQDIPDYRDLDSDNDSLLDALEAGAIDLNGDGIAEGGAATLPLPDADSDGLPDYLDLESSNPLNDATGLFDIESNPNSETLDVDADGVIDNTADNDEDGIPDDTDLADNLFGSTSPYPDADNDSIPDSVESQGDSDGDGTADFQDTDSDNDGVPDIREAGADPQNPVDTDADGTPDYLDQDSDNDGIPDAIEVGANPFLPVDSDQDSIPDLLDRDSDNDSIPDALENSDASNQDSDGDGIDDQYDVDSTGGTDQDNNGIDDNVSPADTDGDTIPNYLDLDSDNDGIPDVIEDDIADGVDNNADGIDDGFQISGNDADNDGVDDNLDATDTDGDGYPDYLDLDSDSDGIPDQIEAGYNATTVNFTQDSDADGVPDAMDADLVATPDQNSNGVVDSLEPVNTDQDSLGIADFRDLDSDNDSLLDTAETGVTDVDEDGLADGVDANADGIIDSGAATAPLRDSDNDGRPDYLDLESSNAANDGSGPFDISVHPDAATLDADNDGMIDDEADLDMDGIQDVVDRASGVFGSPDDSDGDGISNAEEIGPDPQNPVDTDNDGTPDYLDTDSDNDGFSDELESAGCPLSADPGDCDADGVPDRLQDEPLETAVSGAGSFGLLLLLLLPLIGLTKARCHSLVILIAMITITGPTFAHDEFYPAREVVRHQEFDFIEYDEAVNGDRETLLKQNRLFFYPGWYAGIGPGVSKVDPDGSSNGFETAENSSNGFKIYFGRHFRTHWGWEVSFADLGKAELGNPTRPALYDAVVAESGTPEIDYKVPAGWVLYHFLEPNRELNVFAKAGVSFISNSSNNSRIGYEKQSSAQLALGVGMQWRFSDRFYARLEHDSYDEDAAYTGLSIGMYFGGHNEHMLVMRKVEPVPAPVDPAGLASSNTLLDKELCEDLTAAVEQVTFAVNSSELTEASKAVLRKLGISLIAWSEVDIAIQAHTDSDGSNENNQRLSEQRAQAVLEYLVELGVPENRMTSTGFGETQPIADNSSRAGKAQNRRVEFVPVNGYCE